MELRLERNQALGETNLDAAAASRWRRRNPCADYVGVAADAGFRLTPERTQALTEIADGIFPGARSRASRRRSG